MAILQRFYGKLIEKICFKAPGNYSASFWSYDFSICLWENPETLISMISGFSDVSPAPKTSYCIFGDLRTPQENQEISSEHFKNNVFFFTIIKMSEMLTF